MRILICGCDGQLGQAIKNNSPDNIDIIFKNKKKFKYY
tara:strand:- start:348 stop:461 length:114 start_codon:yes stop_codon:yes gene_type:complete